MSTLKSINKRIKKINPSFNATIENQSIRLDGESFSMDEIIKAGYASRTNDHLGVINRIIYKNGEKIENHLEEDKTLDNIEVDCLIIGGGITGLMILRELSRYSLKTLLIDKNSDIAMEEATKSSPLLTGSIDNRFNLKKAIHNFKSRKMYDKLLQNLDVPYKNINNFILLRNKTERFLSFTMLKDAKLLRVRNSSIVQTKRHTVSLDKRIIESSPTALLLRDAKTIDSFRLSLGLAENSIKNGANISLNTECLNMDVDNDKIKCVYTNKGKIIPKIVINAAGLSSDKIADMAKDRTYSILSRVRTHMIIPKDKNIELNASATYFPKEDFYLRSTRIKKVIDYLRHPESYISFGFRIHPLVDGRTLLSSASRVELYNPNRKIKREETETLINESNEILGDISLNDSEKMYVSMDSITYENQIVSRMGVFTKNIYEIAGVNSESLSETPSIVNEAVEQILEYLESVSLEIKQNKTFNPHFEANKHLIDYPISLRDKMIKSNPKYGNILCECKEISLGEVEDVLNYSITPTTLDAVKRRLGIYNMRCSGHMCDLRIVAAISKKKKLPLSSIGKRSTYDKIFLTGGKLNG